MRKWTWVAALGILFGCGRGAAPLPSNGTPTPQATSGQAVQRPGDDVSVFPSEASAESSPALVPGSPTVSVEVAEPLYPPGILFADSFADVEGSIKRHNGASAMPEGPRPSRAVYPFMGKPEEGSILLQVVEDIASRGPDGQLGVLSLAWQELPPAIGYTGFAYHGGNGPARRMNAPQLLRIRTADDLKALRLKFRFRGVKSGRESPVEIKISCRLEPTVPDSYKKRLDMGTFMATGAWGDYDASFSDGENQDAFLRSLADEKPTALKIVWAHVGPIKNYQAGDTLLLDDIVIRQPTEQ